MSGPPRWFCCRPWSLWCVLDTLLHSVGVTVRYVCDRHDKVLMS
jgi:hypothetical protein